MIPVERDCSVHDCWVLEPRVAEMPPCSDFDSASLRPLGHLWMCFAVHCERHHRVERVDLDVVNLDRRVNAS